MHVFTSVYRHIDSKVKVNVDLYSVSSWKKPLRCSGMAHLLKGSHSFTCTPRGIHHTCLFLPSQSWYSFTHPGSMEGKKSWPRSVVICDTSHHQHRQLARRHTKWTQYPLVSVRVSVAFNCCLCHATDCLIADKPWLLVKLQQTPDKNLP